jgi:hypothetical protein
MSKDMLGLVDHLDHLDETLNYVYGVPLPDYKNFWKRTAQGTPTGCEQLNAFVGQCENSLWKSSQCKAVLDWFNGCANSELVHVEGEAICRPVDPSVTMAAAILQANCEKLQRGTDGQNPCDRKPAKGSPPAKVVVSHCKSGVNTLVSPDDAGAATECQNNDLGKFLEMALAPKDYSYITKKLGGPPPPTGVTTKPDTNPKPQPKPPPGLGTRDDTHR